jgi:hypothetical protein
MERLPLKLGIMQKLLRQNTAERAVAAIGRLIGKQVSA